MANTVKMKRSATPGKIPTTTALALGELAVNTNDGKLFLKKSAGGVDSIVDVTAVSSINGKTGDVSLTKSDVGLGSVENTALSTWTGSASITTLGTIGAGTWSGTAIAVPKGGTGASDAATARANLGLAIGANVQAWSTDLDAIDALAGTSGLLKKTALNTWALDTSSYVPSGGALGTPSSGNLANCTFPTLNQNTTGYATYLNAAQSSADKADITTRTNSGFWQTDTATTAEGWPATSNTWYHLIASTHNNTANYYSMQLAADFYTQALYYRSTNGSGTTGWSKILHSNNYTDYTVSKTGAGASGSWGVNITGSAASCTGNAATATTATNWGAYGGVPAAGTSFGAANTIGRSDANGYTFFNYINSNTANSENPSVGQVIVTNGSDNYYRKSSIASFTTYVQSNASGQWPIYAYPRRSDGANITFWWSGQAGQPTWLWGGSDGVNMYVWNPSNFSVNYATTAGNGAKVWCRFSNNTIYAHSGMSSITAGGSQLTMNFAAAQADANYAAFFTINTGVQTTYYAGLCNSQTTTTCIVYIYNVVPAGSFAIFR